MACSKNEKSIESISILLSPKKMEQTLDPSKIAFTNDYFLLENLTLRLVGLNSKGQYENLLAESITPNADKTLYRIKIKEAYFSNGDKITIEDVYYTLKRLVVVGSAHSNLKEFILGGKNIKTLDTPLEGLTIISPDTLTISFSRPLKEFIDYLQMADFGILHPSQYKKKEIFASDWTQYSSGPYRLKYEKDDVYLVKNEKAFNFNLETPKEVKLVSQYFKNELPKQIIEQKIHTGMIPFPTYFANKKQIDEGKGIKLFATTTDKITLIILNKNSPLFKDNQTRRWIQKKIIQTYLLKNTPYDQFLQKAYEYFVPSTKGFMNKDEILSHVKKWANIDSNQIPESLKKGITILSYETLPQIAPMELFKELETVLGIPVKIKLTVNASNIETTFLKRDYDAFINVMAMDYKLIGESINLLYNSSTPDFLDEDGKMKSLLSIYQSTFDEAEEKKILSNIALEMINQAECIPLFYLADPFFYNENFLNVGDANIFESLQVWKMHVAK